MTSGRPRLRAVRARGRGAPVPRSTQRQSHLRGERLRSEAQKFPPDPRSAYQRDRDRILYTPQFRRLAAVTQVVGSHETQLFHNRLTHSVKVAQLARRLAERFARQHADIDPDVAEAAALAQDIGHPPFGHIAEDVLDAILISSGVPDGFEGNAQSFRIITTLATRTSNEPGLNLTRASLQALTKYPWERATTGKHHRKYGAFSDEHDVFEWSRRGLLVTDAQTAEAMIMDWSDDVAYALHDLEDFYTARLVPLARLSRDLDEQEHFLTRTRERWRGQGRVLDAADWDAHVESAEDLFAQFPTERRPGPLMQQFSSWHANLYVSGSSFVNGRLEEDSAMRRQLDLLKSLTWTYVIESPALAVQQQGQRRIVRTLFDYFVEGVNAQPHALPHWAQRHAEAATSSAERLRVACDIVANLTETQAISLYAQLSGTRPGSVLEPAPS